MSDNLKSRREELLKEIAAIDRQTHPQARERSGKVLAPRIGGSFAPPLTPDKLANYRTVADECGGAIGAAMHSLADMVKKFNETAPSPLSRGFPHPSGRGLIVPLEKTEIERIDDVVPWEHELDAMQSLFDAIPAEQKDLRNAAFHLLWYGRELSLDREPGTTDRLEG